MDTEDAGKQLREAIQAGNFDRASALIPEFRGAVERDLASAASDEDRQERLHQAMKFMEESLHLARVVRAHLALKLRATESIFRYQLQQDTESRWSLTG